MIRDSDPSPRTPALKLGPGDSIRDLIAFFVRYFELRLQLFGLEAREAGVHLFVVALLAVSTVICLVGFVAMLIVFLLYLMMRILHWEWGWSALALSAAFFLVSFGAGVIFKFRILKPVFSDTFAEFQKDRKWLEHTTKNSG
jgi:uncharacterized membrane protein YqjE